MSLVLLGLWITSFCHIEAARAQASPAYLVEDLVAVPDATAGLSPAAMTVVGDQLYFTGWHPLTGRELWTSDGTPEGTRLVADTRPGRSSGILSAPVTLDGALYFESCDDLVCQLWRSDGTPEGTAAITSFSRPERVLDLTVWDGALYFGATDATHGAELYRSDGTVAGTRRISDLAPGSGDRRVRFPVAVGERLLFAATTEGNEIWATDGTESGNTFLRSLGHDSFFTSPILTAGSRAFFIEGFFDLWTSDGTAAGTRRVYESERPLNPLAAFAGNFYFTRSSDSFAERELWISNGTAAGTRRLRGGYEATFAPTNALALFGELYFSFRNELWRTDGTTAGTVAVADAGQLIQSLGAGAHGDELLVGTDRGLWRVDGDGGLELIADGISARGFTAFRDGAAFRSFTEDAGSELAHVAGNTVTALSDVVDPGSSDPFELTASGDSLVFADALSPAGAYETDGVTTRRLRTPPGHEGLDRRRLSSVAAGGRTFVLEEDLWVVRGDELDLLFEGREEGAEAVRLPLRGTATAFGDRLYFLVWDFGTDQIDLWTSDGSRDGTRQLDELTDFEYCFLCDPPEPEPTFGTVVAGDRLFTFFENRLWVTDGTEGGAAEVDLGDRCNICKIGPAATVGHRLFFGTRGLPSFGPPVEPRRLWTSDGTAAGTFVIRDFAPPYPGGAPAEMAEIVGVGDRLFFTVETPELGDELWHSDGTAAGTGPVRDVRPGRESSNPRWLTAAGSQVYFAADDGVTGRELWAADLAGTGARRIADLRPGTGSSFPTELKALDGRLVFAADDGVTGLEPWTYDGISRGPVLLQDVQPGRLPSTSSSFRAAGDLVYFSAGTGDSGFELWAAGRPSCANCLLDRRFLVTARWLEDGVVSEARPVAFSDETALFWFFERSNTELLVKLIDGRGLNGHFWVYYGALSDLEYEIRVEDLSTGEVRTYHNPRGNLCGGADTLAFRDAGASSAVDAAAKLDAASECPAEERELCLGRFRVQVDWANPYDGGTGIGVPIQDTDETGYFWFFEPRKLELAVKLLDGRAVNGKYWFFYGALSDVEYRITVRDVETGAVRVYHNAPGNLCGGGDIEAFDP